MCSSRPSGFAMRRRNSIVGMPGKDSGVCRCGSSRVILERGIEREVEEGSGGALDEGREAVRGVG